MKSNFKTACILIDKDDLTAFRGSYKDVVPKESCWFPVAFSPIMQLIYQEAEERYYLPRLIEENDCFVFTKQIYNESQKYLKQLFLTNKIIDRVENSFPLEYFWLCIWVETYRIILFCNDLLSQCPVEKVILIERNKLVNKGGLLVDTASFVNLVKDIFKSKNIKVRCIKHKNRQIKPKTIFYEQRRGLSPFLRVLKFVHWKILSFNRKNHNCILINPAYDNVINYRKPFIYSSRNPFPQIFHSGQIPFLHSWSKLLRFLIAETLFKKNFSDYNTSIIKSYHCKFFSFEFDFAGRFYGTIVQYLNDVNWMKNYIDLFWRTCLENGRRYLTIFSLPAVHLHSYFLAKKTKEVNGKVAVWQHGGFYGYTDHFLQYVTDYKTADYFLSSGKDNINDVISSAGDSRAICVQVGSNAINEKSIPCNSGTRELSSLKGLIIPTVIGTFCSQARIKWNGPLYFGAIKQIIDFFGSGTGCKVVVKGLKSHNPHLELKRYIERKKYKLISYIDKPIDKVLLDNPRFVILDNPSTPLLQVLAQYAGPIFLMVNQESWAIRKDALVLLKSRVVYSQSVDELKLQLTDFFRTGFLEGVDIEDKSFVDVYLKQFRYSEYEHFLQEATKKIFK